MSLQPILLSKTFEIVADEVVGSVSFLVEKEIAKCTFNQVRMCVHRCVCCPVLILVWLVVLASHVLVTVDVHIIVYWLYMDVLVYMDKLQFSVVYFFTFPMFSVLYWCA